MTLALQWEACVRTRSTAATCQRCVDACPASAISLDGPRASVKVDLATCTSCGQCQPVCPAGAFSGLADVAGFMASAGAQLACTPAFCLGHLATEDLVTLALRHQSVTVDGAGCASCREDRSLVLERVEQANTFLSASGFDATLRLTVKPGAAPASAPPAPTPAAASRRALLHRLVPGLVQEAAKAPLALAPMGTGALEPARLKERPLPARRERLLSQLKASTRARAAVALDEAEVPFTSDKVLDLVTCTGCLQCVSVCPTAALTATRTQDEVLFDAARCLKCRACHDVCEPKAITVAPRFQPSALLAQAPRSLGRFTVKACTECGARFKYDGGDAVCPRCVGHDDEARELHGLPPRSGARS